MENIWIICAATWRVQFDYNKKSSIYDNNFPDRRYSVSLHSLRPCILK